MKILIATATFILSGITLYLCYSLKWSKKILYASAILIFMSLIYLIYDVFQIQNNWIFTLILILIAVVSLFGIYYWFKNRTTSAYKNTVKLSSVAAIISIWILIIPFLNYKAPRQSNNGLTDEEVEENNKADRKEAAQKAKQKKVEKAANTNINQILADDKKDFADGNSRYQYSNYIQKIKYTTDSTEVYVNVDFNSLDDNFKNQVAEKVQGAIGAGVAMSDAHYKPANDQKGYSLYFWLDKHAIGHSKMTDNHQYKWYSNN